MNPTAYTEPKLVFLKKGPGLGPAHRLGFERNLRPEMRGNISAAKAVYREFDRKYGAGTGKIYAETRIWRDFEVF